ncbi:MAG: cytochrome c peroxidase [Polyangiaceae bacterium]
MRQRHLLPNRFRLMLGAALGVAFAAAEGLSCSSEGTGTGGSGETSASSTASSGSGVGGGAEIPPTFTAAELAALAELSPAVLPKPPPDPTNAFADDPAAAALGKALFFSPIFSGALLDGDNDGSPATLGFKGETGKVACASCHLPGSDFNDTRSPSRQISLATGWGRRRAPSLLDVGQTKVLMWDGRHDTLYNQVFGPLESAVEMNSSRLFVAEQIHLHFKAQYEAVFGPLPALDQPPYPALSAAATGCTPSTVDPAPECNGTWHGSPGDGAEYDGLGPDAQDAVTRVVVNAGKAIAAYERLLTCGAGRFDAWMHGDAAALSPSEQRRAQLFVGAGKCVGCHTGPFLSDQKFHNVGLAPALVAAAFIDSDDHGAASGLAAALSDPLNSKGTYSDGDDGRLPATVTANMEGSFRTPILRCVARRPSFMHTGQLRTLEAVVEFFSDGGHPGGFFGTREIAPLGLSTSQRDDLVAFLGALDGPGADASLLSE